MKHLKELLITSLLLTSITACAPPPSTIKTDPQPPKTPTAPPTSIITPETTIDETTEPTPSTNPTNKTESTPTEIDSKPTPSTNPTNNDHTTNNGLDSLPYGNVPTVTPYENIAISNKDIPNLLKTAENINCNVKNIRIESDESIVYHGNATVDLDGNIIISKYLPRDYAESVIIHECAHLLQYSMLDFDNIDLLDNYYQPFKAIPNALPTVGLENKTESPTKETLISGIEQNADCIAKEWGATVSFYTDDCTGTRGEVARQMIKGIPPTK